MGVLLNFVQGQCIKYGIDESHGLKHARGTWIRASKIIKTLPDMKEEESRVALCSAVLHDMCDSKYCNSEEASRDIEYFLMEIHMCPEEIEAVLKIIKTMSYSKLKASIKDGIIQYPDHGKWQRAYHIARNADLLEGYIVARSILYNKHIYPEKSEDEHWKRAEEIFNDRVFKYLSDGWINLPFAIDMVPYLEQEARRCLKGRLMDWPEQQIT
jgi:hypothetical protein